MDVLRLTVDLIDQREVELEMFHAISVVRSRVGLVHLKLHVLDHVREPDAQAVVTELHQSTHNTLLPFSTKSLFITVSVSKQMRVRQQT